MKLAAQTFLSNLPQAQSGATLPIRTTSDFRLMAQNEGYNGICIHSKTVDAYLFLVEETKVVHSLPNEKKQVQSLLLLEFVGVKKSVHIYSTIPKGPHAIKS